MRVVFMGTPDFAVESLKTLIDEFEVVGVFTQPDKPKGRGYELCPPPIKVLAEQHNIPVFQPQSVKGEEALGILKELKPDVIAVVAYGKMLPVAILKLPKYGCVNVHASLLPRHRGASPIQWAIVSGDEYTGVSTQRMEIGMDTGDVYHRTVTKIGEDETADSLHDRLSIMGAKALRETLNSFGKEYVPVPLKQSEAEATYAPIIKKEMAKIDFSKTAREIDCAVRGFYSWPCAYFFINGKRIKVFKVASCDKEGTPAEIIESKDRLVIGCKGGSVEILEVQLEGKKRMKAAEMLRGFRIEKDSVIS